MQYLGKTVMWITPPLKRFDMNATQTYCSQPISLCYSIIIWWKTKVSWEAFKYKFSFFPPFKPAGHFLCYIHKSIMGEYRSRFGMYTLTLSGYNIYMKSIIPNRFNCVIPYNFLVRIYKYTTNSLIFTHMTCAYTCMHPQQRAWCSLSTMFIKVYIETQVDKFFFWVFIWFSLKITFLFFSTPSYFIWIAFNEYTRIFIYAGFLWISCETTYIQRWFGYNMEK